MVLTKGERRAARPEEPSLAIVADDLTGACDAAVAFAGVCSSVVVEIGGVPTKMTPVWAVSSDSRNLEPAQARQRVEDLLRQLPAGMQVFKKVDSVFRGNTLEEICAALETSEYDLAVLTPAHPHLGRRMVGGMLLVCELNGERTLEVAGPLAAMGHPGRNISPGLPVEEVAAKMKNALKDGDRLMLCDALDPEDLRTSVRAARSLGVRVFWIGSGGLAQALAEEFPTQNVREPMKRKGNVIFFIGSTHAATRAQVLHLKRVRGVKMGLVECESGHKLFSVNYGQTEAEVRQAMKGISPQEVGCLFLTGGDTANLVCRALGITSLLLQWEFVPGVPLAIAQGGAFDGIPMILKSGAFGGRGVLRDVLEAFELRKAVVA